MGLDVGHRTYTVDVRAAVGGAAGGVAGYALGRTLDQPIRRITEFHLAYRASAETTISNATGAAIGYAAADSMASSSSTADEITRAAGVALGREGSELAADLSKLSRQGAESKNVAAKVAGQVGETVLDSAGRTVNAARGIKQAHFAQIGVKAAIIGVATLGAVLLANAVLPDMHLTKSVGKDTTS